MGQEIWLSYSFISDTIMCGKIVHSSSLLY